MIELVGLFVDKILWIGFFLSILNVLRHGYNLVKTYFENEERDEIKKYIISTKSLIALGLSVAFILMSIFTGISLN